MKGSHWKTTSWLVYTTFFTILIYDATPCYIMYSLQEKGGGGRSPHDTGTPPMIEIPRSARGTSPLSSRNSPLLSSNPRRRAMGASPVSSRNSSLSGSTPPIKMSRSVALSERGNAGGRTLGERLEAALGERTGPDEGIRRVMMATASTG